MTTEETPEEEQEYAPARGAPRRGGFGRDWTKGSILRNLLSLGWPMSVGGIMTMLGPTIDMFWVGKLGTSAIAGVGVASTAVMVVNSARMGLTTGTRAMVARFVGAGNLEGANHVAQQAVVVSALFSTAMALVGVLLAEPIMLVLGVAPDVVAEGAAYMRIMFVGSVAMSFRMMGESVMQASGDALTPMLASTVFRLFHLALCPFLVFGWWIFPNMGVSGAAMTNVVSQSLGGVMILGALFAGRSIDFDVAAWKEAVAQRRAAYGPVAWLYGLATLWRLPRRGPSRMRLSLRGFSLDRHMIWRIVRIGIPASVTGIERSFANLLLVTFVTPFGTTAVAAHSLIQRVAQFLHMPAMGLGQAAGVLAGQNLGAEQPGRAERTGWIAAALFTGFMVVGAVVVWFFADGIIGIFDSSPDVMSLGGDFLRIEIVSFLVFGLVLVLSQCLNGVGATMVPMVTTLLSMWLIQVPLAYFLPRHTLLGVYGVRVGIVSAIVLRAVIYSAYFKAGRWKLKKV
jgi:Na+-driven multidrug efflux pump